MKSNGNSNRVHLGKMQPAMHLFRCVRNITLLCLASLPLAAVGAKYEAPPDVSAKKTFPDTELKTGLYEVESRVPTDGFLTRARITSRFGDFVAVGPGMLEIRLKEVEALAKLEELEDSDEFQRAVKDSAGEKTSGLEKIIDNPKESAEGMAEGIGRFFKRSYRSAKTSVQIAADVAQEKSPGSIEGSGPGANLPGKAIEEAGDDGESKYAKVARASGDAALNLLGFDDARRRLCKRMEVDPYTTNKVLDEKLDEVTKSLFAGDLAVDFATKLIPGASLVSTSNKLGNWVWDVPPGDLRVQIEQQLLAIEVSQEDVDRLLRHRWYPLSLKAALTHAVTALEDVKGRPDIMPLVLTVTTFDQARFVVNTLRMTANYHQTVAPLDALQVIGTVVGWRADGKAVVASPVDYLSWSEGIDGFAGREEFKGRELDVHIAGRMSEKAATQLKERSWNITQNSSLFKQTVGRSG